VFPYSVPPHSILAHVPDVTRGHLNLALRSSAGGGTQGQGEAVVRRNARGPERNHEQGAIGPARGAHLVMK
jgi:hypothetical protein